MIVSFCSSWIFQRANEQDTKITNVLKHAAQTERLKQAMF